MEVKWRHLLIIICIFIHALQFANAALDDQESYYPHDPHSNSRGPPGPSSGGGGSGSNTPIVSRPPTAPAQGGGHGGYYNNNSPPPRDPRSNSHSPPGPSNGGGSNTPIISRRPPTAPSHGGGRGGYYNNNNPPPPSSSSVPIISTSPPVTPTPILAPVTPTPSFGPPATPALPFDPNSLPFTCYYWKTHPALIWGLLGCWGNIAQFFGAGAASIYGSNPSLPEALANTRNDGIGALYREGTAALLNSIINNNFVFTTQQVNHTFNVAILSNTLAASQAQLFKKANEGVVS